MYASYMSSKVWENDFLTCLIMQDSLILRKFSQNYVHPVALPLQSASATKFGYIYGALIM